jgi:hypothetical protein
LTARTRSVIAGALLLLTGAAGGVAVDHLIVFRRHAAMSDSGATHTAVLLAELDRVLSLTPAQHEAIGAILVRHQQAIDSAWRVIHHQVDAGMDSVHREVRAILRPEQMALLREWMMKQQMQHGDVQ